MRGCWLCALVFHWSLRPEGTGEMLTFLGDRRPWDWSAEDSQGQQGLRVPVPRLGHVCLPRDPGGFSEPRATGRRQFVQNEMVRNECFWNVPNLDIGD